MTLNWYKFTFSWKFSFDGVTVKNASEGWFSELRPIYQGCRALTFALARLSCYQLCHLTLEPSLSVISYLEWHTDGSIRQQSNDREFDFLAVTALCFLNDLEVGRRRCVPGHNAAATKSHNIHQWDDDDDECAFVYDIVRRTLEVRRTDSAADRVDLPPPRPRPPASSSCLGTACVYRCAARTRHALESWGSPSYSLTSAL